jgi:hypothetical protein
VVCSGICQIRDRGDRLRDRFKRSVRWPAGSRRATRRAARPRTRVSRTIRGSGPGLARLDGRPVRSGDGGGNVSASVQSHSVGAAKLRSGVCGAAVRRAPLCMRARQRRQQREPGRKRGVGRPYTRAPGCRVDSAARVSGLAVGRCWTLTRQGQRQR